MGSEVEPLAALVDQSGLEHSLAHVKNATSEDVGRLLDEFRPYLLAIANAELPRALAGKLGPSDLVQMTIARGHGKFSTFQGTSPEELARWLRKILQNHLKAERRAYSREKRKSTREQPAAADLAHPRQLSPSGEALSREERETLQRALSRLPEPYRSVIELRHVEDLSFEEIGRRLERTDEAARKLWTRAVKQLQRELGIDGKR